MLNAWESWKQFNSSRTTLSTYVALQVTQENRVPFSCRGGAEPTGKWKAALLAGLPEAGWYDKGVRKRWEGRRRVWRMRWSFTLPREGWLMAFFSFLSAGPFSPLV